MNMRSWKKRGLVLTATVVVAFAAASVRADETGAAGVVRINDGNPPSAVIQNVDYRSETVAAPVSSVTPVNNVTYAYYGDAVYYDDCYAQQGPIKSWWNGQMSRFYARNARESSTLRAHLRCKWGYFIPTGCGGEGCPPIGTYQMVYAVDPHYGDQRDGRVYASNETGVPMSVPLAPVVGHTYNYGWGFPSSRLTPISRVVPGH